MQYLHTYDQWVQDILDGMPISFSRWGDGEMCAVLGTRVWQQNCDGHQFFPRMGQELKAILLSRPAYRLGLMDLERVMYAGQGGPKKASLVLNPFLTQNKLYNYPWYSAEVWHRAFRAGQIHRLVNALSTRKLLLVGPEHLANIQGLTPFKHIVIPSKNCYRALESIYQNIVQELKTGDNCLVSLSASMPCNILVDRLFHSHGQEHSFIDFGAVWDPLAGVLSRKYMRN